MVAEIFRESESVMQFKKGFEEASKFIPNGNLFINLESKGMFLQDLKEDVNDVLAMAGVKRENYNYEDGLRGKKNPYPEESTLEGSRSNKQSAVYSGSTASPEDFDRVLLNCGKDVSALQAPAHIGESKSVQKNGQAKGSNGGKARGKRQGGKKNVVDLRTLLTLCAQAVAADDRRSANDLLKQIRQNSPPTGDAMQRLANIFADGLEARLAGSGTQIYKALISKPTSAADVLKAYHMFLAACPFRKLSNFFSNKTIMNIAENATKVHIVDFGILYGFQWPCLIQRLSSRPGGPPHLRITGIDLPNPGFRPAERVEETGRRLANYANTFKVPFEFKAIAQKWDTIKIEDLKIDRNEVLVVNSLYRLRNLLDETVVVESPRNIVLNLIRNMNPDVFIQGVVNGAYNAPFFITRFREALFHFSTLFDVLEANVSREVPERMLIEREIFGWEAMNVIACEGAERIERPETYKQWQMRILRAGFRQLPLNQEIYTTAKEKVEARYHKDFVIDEDSHWLLQGWKGRIVYALSSWKPDC
ncbi:SCARECROW-LIKE PROTEIN 14 [Salix koriyanagi]|nr:SCARECROW-LIKE PROTEIN 14 [Salix koriyanagi]